MQLRTIYITGASSGIGRAMALEYASRGAHIAIAARRKDELERLVARIEERGGLANVIPVDVSDPGAAAEAVRRAERELGALDMVIANAGVGHEGHASTLAWADVERVLDVNVKGAMATLVAAIPIMLSQQRGHLVGVSSLAGRRGLPTYAPYCASKAALSAFLETIRMDLAGAGIRVTDVQPGFVETPMIEAQSHASPLLWPAPRAARYIVRRLDRAPPIISFPWPLSFLTAFSRTLPAWVYEPIVRLVTGIR
jgi:NAD(P)-dependent dehydrogenase (short-subunit alcohol dehydrogenase family)